MMHGRGLLAGVSLALVLGVVAQASQPEVPAIKAVYFQTNSAKPEAPERLSSTLAAVAEQARSFRSRAIVVVPEGAMDASSDARKRLLAARAKVVVDALTAAGVARETISVRPLLGEGAEFYDGDPARSAGSNGVSILVVPDPALYGPGFRPMMPETAPLPAPSKLPEVHLDDH